MLLLDEFTSQNHQHLVFKYMQTNLRAMTEARAGCWFSWAEADCIIQQIAAGIRHLHHFGLAHGDLSDNNILLSGSQPSGCQAGLTAGWEVRVADYASAFALTDPHDSFSPGVHITTPSFEAPEVLLGLCPTTAVDHFALGVHCVTLACGQRAVFDRATPRKIALEDTYPVKPTSSQKTSRTNARAFVGRLVCLGGHVKVGLGGWTPHWQTSSGHLSTQAAHLQLISWTIIILCVTV